MPPLPIDFRALFDASPNPYMVLDRDLRYVAANRAYLAVTSTARLEDLLGRHILEAFPDDPDGQASDNARLLKASLEKVLATREPDVLALIPYRIAVETAAGRRVEERYWSATHTPLFDARGEVAFVLQHTVDVTELQRSKEAAQPASSQPGAPPRGQVEAGVLGRAQVLQERMGVLDSEVRWLRRVFDQAPGFVCVLRGRELVFELANASYVQLVGQRELLGRPLREALPEIAGQGFVELLDQVMRSGTAYVGSNVRVELRRTSGAPLEERYVDFVYQPIVDANGAIAGIFVQGHDITVQRQLEAEHAALLAREKAARAEAEAANRAKDEFLAMMSHELRTPLNAVLGWTRMLRTEALPVAQRPRALETIERNARSQLALIEDVLDVSRIVAGKLRLEIATVDLRTVVETALETARLAADARGVALEVALAAPAALVMGDANRLQQVVGNLLSNAVKFTPRGGRITVRLAREDTAVVLVVADTGQGIAPEFLPHVFERFRQADASSARAHGGLGLGLAIVAHIVELHGGVIRAESGGPGCGATFTVRLPVAPPRRAVVVPGATAAPFECPPAVRGLAVLVVDDEPDARDLLRVVLEHCDVRVHEAARTSEALEVLARVRPDVLISDVGIPGEDGYGLIRKVRALPDAALRRTPAIALTAYAHSDDRARATLAGFDHHVAKPVEPAELLAVIAALRASRA